MRRLWVALLVLLSAAELPGPWVQFTSDGGLDIRAITAPGMPCPKVVADGIALESKPRGAPDNAYPVQVCVAHLATPSRAATVDGVPVPALPGTIKRIVVIGDTGCRLKGSFVQDCNDPVKWPFGTEGRAGCAGSPFGDVWAVWQHDFFSPAAPLLAAAPWVLVRGNHELCSRGGHGWFRLLDPHPDVACVATTAPYPLHADALNLLVLDGADADDDKADPAKVAVYRGQMQTLLANATLHSWLLTHRPIWAMTEGEGAAPGATLNATEQAAINGLVPAGLDLVLSGHIHDLTSYEFGPARPAQLVVGEGGDANDAIVQPITAGMSIDGMKLRRAFASPDWGYLVLHRTATGWAGTVYSIADTVLANCRIHGRDLACHAAAR